MNILSKFMTSRCSFCGCLLLSVALFLPASAQKPDPGADLMLLHPDGRAEVLVPGGATGAITDPVVSFDGEGVFYSQVKGLDGTSMHGKYPSDGSDIFKLHMGSRKLIQLTHQEYTSNTGAAEWASDFRSNEKGKSRIEDGVLNLGVHPLPGNRLVFTSNRDGFIPPKHLSPALQLFTVDYDGKNVEKIPVRAGFSRALELSYQSKGGEKRERRVFLWYPTESEEIKFKYAWQSGMVSPDAPVKVGAHPMIVFSHGFWGGADQSVFLMEALARAGYVVAAVHHADATPNQVKKRIGMPNFINAKGWKDDKFFDRKEDMSALLDFMLEQNGDVNSILHGRLLPGVIGGAGHSLGGYTMLGMAGVRESWKDPRVKAALLLSPYILPYFHHGDLGRVKVPVMVQGGTLDLGVTPFLKRFYDGLTSQKYYLVLKGLDHYGWTDFNSIGRTTTEALRKGNPKLIAEYSLAFFDQHLRGIDRKKALAHREEEIHSWRATPGAE